MYYALPGYTSLYVLGVPWWVYLPVCPRCTMVGIHLPVYAGIHHPGYTCYMSTQHWLLVQQRVVHSEDALGSRREKPLGGREERVLRSSILLRLESPDAQSYSALPGITNERSDRRRDNPRYIPLGTVLLRIVVPVSHPIVLVHDAQSAPLSSCRNHAECA